MSRDLRCKADFMRLGRVFQIGVGFLIVYNALHKVIHFFAEGMVRHVSAIGKYRRNCRPAALSHPALLENLIIADGPHIAEQLNVEDVGHDTFDGRSNFAYCAVFKFHQRHAVRFIFVVKGISGAGISIGEHLNRPFPDKPSQTVHRVATRRKQAATTNSLLYVPRILGIPGPYLMEVIHFTIKKRPHHAVIESSAKGLKQRIPAQDEAHQGFHPRFTDGSLKLTQPFKIQGHRFFKQQMFSSFGTSDSLHHMQMMWRTNGNNVNTWSIQHLFEMVIASAVLKPEFFCLRMRPVAITAYDGPDFRPRIRSIRTDMLARNPACTNNCHAKILHESASALTKTRISAPPSADDLS